MAAGRTSVSRRVIGTTSRPAQRQLAREARLNEPVNRDSSHSIAARMIQLAEREQPRSRALRGGGSVDSPRFSSPRAVVNSSLQKSQSSGGQGMLAHQLDDA